MRAIRKNTLLAQYNYSHSQLDDICRAFWAIAKTYNVILLYGEMGAGKTTFISHLCHQLNITDEVSSPTFSLINEYHFTDPAKKDRTIFHIDLYRLNSFEEVINAGIEDCMEQALLTNNYVFIEWPEKIVGITPKPYLQVYIESITEEIRCMKVYENV